MNKCCLEYCQPSRPKNLQDGDLFPTLSVLLQACRTIEYWCLSLRGHCLCCQMIRRKQMKIFLECKASWWWGWGQTCSSSLLPGRHLKGFFLVDEHWEQRILPNLGERRAAKNSDKAMTHLLWPFSFVSKRWRKIIGPKSSLFFLCTIIVSFFALFYTLFVLRANKSFEERIRPTERPSSKHVMHAHYSCPPAYSRSVSPLFSQYSVYHLF